MPNDAFSPVQGNVQQHPTPMAMQQPSPGYSPDMGMGGGGAQRNFISQEDITDPRDEVFEQAFKEAAYDTFTAKHPNLVPSLVTFKVIKTDINEGDGVGAFIISHQGESLYVPVIMSGNKMKPMEIFYSKRMDKFLPFNRDWIGVVSSSSQNQLGEAVKVPENLPADVDISKFVHPPIDGRNAYAEDFGGLDHLEIIKEASNEVKDQYRNLLKSDYGILKFAYAHFSKEKIAEALAPHEKTAKQEIKLETVSLDDPSAKIKEVFGEGTGQAMKDIARNGFAHKDPRPDLNKAYSHDFKMQLEEPTQSGVYTIYEGNGTPREAVVIMNPMRNDTHENVPVSEYESRDRQEPSGESVYGDWTVKHKNTHDMLVILDNGDFFTTDRLIATPGSKLDVKSPALKRIYESSGDKGITKSNMFFVKVEGDIINALRPSYVDVTEVNKDNDVKYIKYDQWKLKEKKNKDTVQIYDVKEADSCIDRCFVVTENTKGRIMAPKGGRLTVVPATYKAIKLGDSCRNYFLNNSEELLKIVQAKLADKGGQTVKLSSIGGGEYAIDGHFAGDLREASVKLAEDYYLHMDVCVNEFSGLKMSGDHTTIIVDPNEKRASIFDGGTQGTQMTPELAQQMPGPGGQGQQGQDAYGGGPQGPMQGEVGMGDPSMMQAGVNTQDPDLYNVGALGALSNNPDIRELLAVHSPTLEKSLDNIGRMLMVFWVKGNKAKVELGDEVYSSTETAMRDVFKGLGKLLIKVNRQVNAQSNEAM